MGREMETMEHLIWRDTGEHGRPNATKACNHGHRIWVEMGDCRTLNKAGNGKPWTVAFGGWQVNVERRARKEAGNCGEPCGGVTEMVGGWSSLRRTLCSSDESGSLRKDCAGIVQDGRGWKEELE